MKSVTGARRRRSIEIEGVSHGNAPIPMGARVGNIIFSSGLLGKDPQADGLSDDPIVQAKFLFENLRTFLKNADATLDDVVHVAAYLRDNRYREILNAEWVKCFPDPHDRPARHTVVKELPGNLLMQLEIVAVAED